jgi:hypothetical protein
LLSFSRSKAVRCHTPEALENGRIQFDFVDQNNNNNNNNSMSYNSTIRYECDRGYVLAHGDESRRCTNTMEWSGAAPVCVRIRCGQLLLFSQAEARKHSLAVAAANCDIFQHGTTYEAHVDYKCHYGYRFYDHTIKAYSTNSKHRRVCNESGQWDSFEPTCERN